MLDTTGWPYVDGERGRIGLITPAPGSSTEWEFHRYKPKGVAVLTTRIPLFEISYEGISKMTDYVEQAAVMLAKSAVTDIILFSCTAGSFLEGGDYDEELIAGLEKKTGVKVTTTSTCMKKAVRALNLHSMHVVTPYSHEINMREKAFLEHMGVRVKSISGANLNLSQDTPKIPGEIMADYVRQADTPDGDGVFISCTGLHVDEIIEPLEKELNKPVITSNQCGLWGCLRELGIKDEIEHLGQLFRL